MKNNSSIKYSLELENLSVEFYKNGEYHEVLSIKALKVKEGETFGIIGESSSGKTVFALSILKLLERDVSKVYCTKMILNGIDITNKSEREMQKKIRGSEVTMIFQDPMSSLNPVFTVGKQMNNVLKRHYKYDNKTARLKAIELLIKVQLPDPDDVYNKYPHELSGGQRQRIIIALAIGCNTKLLIADEPTRNLDVTVQAGILKLIDELQKEFNMTVIYLANNPGVVSLVCKRTAILKDGKIIEDGLTSQVLKRPREDYTKLLLGDLKGEVGRG